MSNPFTWKFLKLKPVNEAPQPESNKWVHDIQRIFRNGFGRKNDWPTEKLHRKLDHCSLLGFLFEDKKPHSAALGYAMYFVPNEPFRGKAILWEEAICTVKDNRIRGKGLANAALLNAMECFPELDFGFLGGRTQNPRVCKRYAAFGRLCPFDFGYDTDEGRDLMRFLQMHIVDVGSAKRLDPLTGICRSEYSEGRLGDYEIRVQGTDGYESVLKEWGFDRDNGDAIIVVARKSKTPPEIFKT